MKAIRVIAGPNGGHTALMELPIPELKPGMVRVRVMASGLNRGEIAHMSWHRSGPPGPAGVEFAGLVDAVGSGAGPWKPGDRVMGHGAGSHAEYILAAPGALMPVPEALNWVQAASFPNVFITAHDALISNAAMQPGETVLVNAASSGVGLAAIQLAKLMGARRVFGSTRSSAKAARLAAFGVDVAIDRSNTDLGACIAEHTDGKGVDVIIDCVGGSDFEANVKALAVKGRLVNISRLGGSKATMDLEQLWLKRLRIIGVTFRTRSEEERVACVQACARDALPLLEAGRIQLPVERTYPMAQIAQAHAFIQQDQHLGKIVLTMDPAA